MERRVAERDGSLVACVQFASQLEVWERDRFAVRADVENGESYA